MRAEATVDNGGLVEKILAHKSNRAEPMMTDSGAMKTHARGEVKPITATPYVWRPATEIPPRHWLFRKHYLRKFLVATAGAAGVGKSSITLADCVSMAIGCDLLTGQPLPNGPLRVWLYNTEDPREEIERRIAALFLHYGVKGRDIGDRLFIDTAREQKLVIAKNVDGNTASVPRIVDELVAEIMARRIDVLGADPLIHTHAVPENDNTGMGEVMSAWREVAERGNCCVELTHHFRKNGGAVATAEDMRGAVAILGSVRSLRLVTQMSQNEAKQFGIIEESRRFHIWVNPTGKPSLVPPDTRRDWYMMKSINLENGTEKQPSDEVGVATPWTPPGTAEGIAADDARRVWRAIRDVDPATQARASTQADGWVGKLIATTLGLDLTAPGVRAKITRMLAEWKRTGKLTETLKWDTHTRRDVPVYILGSAQQVCADDDADDLS